MRTRYEFEILGYNFRLTDLAAAIGLVQLDKLPRNTARRQAIAARYDDAFADLPVLRPVVPADRTHVYHQYTLRVGPRRDEILADLRANGIGADVYYPLPVHRQAYIQERGLHADLPVTDMAAAETLSLPMFPGLGEDEQTIVIEAVRRAVERFGGLDARTLAEAGEAAEAAATASAPPGDRREAVAPVAEEVGPGRPASGDR